MNGIFRESTLGVISKVKNVFLWTAVCLLIGIFAVGAFVLLSKNYNDIIGRILATIGILTVVLFVGVNNFIRMEKGDRIVQIFALIGLITGILGSILGILLIWEVLPILESHGGNGCVYNSNISDFMCTGGMAHYAVSAIAKITYSLTILAGASFWISNVMAIKETIKVVKLLKITSVICETYCAVYVIAVIVSEKQELMQMNLIALAQLVSFAFFVTAIAAWIISRANSKKQNAVNVVSNTPKTDEELRAEIEEKVRREMIEKEVREKIEAESNMQKDDLEEQKNIGLSSDGQF